MTRALVFHNPDAGIENLPPEELQALLRRGGFDPRYVSTKSAPFRAMLGEKADLVIIAGGDGTVADVLCGRRDRSTPVAILPLGTANNVANSLGIPWEAREVASCLRSFVPRLLRVGIADGPWGRREFVEAVGLGAFAGLMQTSGGKSDSREANIRKSRKALRKLIRNHEPAEIGLAVDGREQRLEVVFCEVLNILHAGPAVPLGTRFSAQTMEVAILRPGDRKAFMEWLEEAPLQGLGACPPPVTRIEGRKVEVTGNLAARVDDAVVDMPKRKSVARIGLEPEPFSILAPPAPNGGMS